MSVTLRLATVDDAAELSRFGAAAFIDWYLPDNEPENVYAHVEATYRPELQAAEIAEPGQWALLAHVNGTLAGYTLLRIHSACPEGVTQADAEIRRFYVGREWHGLGVAVQLMQGIVRQGQSAGARGFWLTCWERNPRALAFYAKCGFVRVGTATFTVGNDPQTDHLLALDFSKSHPSTGDAHA
jgi:GNAT superfamily N-acetyltransferase